MCKHIQQSSYKYYQPKIIKKSAFGEKNNEGYGGVLAKFDFRENQIALIVLMSSDGGASHAVTIANGWIFDSNESVALPLTQQALDYCTWDKTNRTTCVGFHSGYVFTDHKNRIVRPKKRKKKRQRRTKK